MSWSLVSFQVVHWCHNGIGLVLRDFQIETQRNCLSTASYKTSHMGIRISRMISHLRYELYGIRSFLAFQSLLLLQCTDITQAFCRITMYKGPIQHLNYLYFK